VPRKKPVPAESRARLLGLAQYLAFVVAPALVVVPLANRVFDDPDEANIEARVRAAMSTDNPAQAHKACAGLIAQGPLNPRYHWWYIDTHFKQPKGHGESARDDEALFREYRTRCQSADPDVADIGRFGLGVFFGAKKDYEKALEWFGKVEDTDLSHLSLLRARTQYKLQRHAEARASFRRAIGVDGYTRTAVRWLAHLLMEQGDWNELQALYDEPDARTHFPTAAARKLDLRNGHLVAYLASPLFYVKDKLNPVGLLGAMLVSVVWLLFLKRVDVFETEKGAYIAATFLLGMAFSCLAFPLYDLWELCLASGSPGSGRRT